MGEHGGLRELVVEGDHPVRGGLVGGEDAVADDVLAHGVAAGALVGEVRVAQGLDERGEVLGGVDGEPAEEERAGGGETRLDVVARAVRPVERRAQVSRDVARARLEEGGELVRPEDVVVYAPPAVERRGDAKHARSLRADGRGWGRVRRVVRKVFAHQRRRRASRKRRHETIRVRAGVASPARGVPWRARGKAREEMCRQRRFGRASRCGASTVAPTARRRLGTPSPGKLTWIALFRTGTTLYQPSVLRLEIWLGVTTPTGARASRPPDHVPRVSSEPSRSRLPPRVRREPPLEVQAHHHGCDGPPRPER